MPWLEIIIFVLNIGLIAAAIWLNRVVSGSVFAAIPKYLIVLGVALVLHAATHLVLSGPLQALIYDLTALVGSVVYLLVVYGVFAALKNISARGGEGP
jgi:hypothetical protein